MLKHRFNHYFCHSSEGWNPVIVIRFLFYRGIPASAGMTKEENIIDKGKLMNKSLFLAVCIGFNSLIATTLDTSCSYIIGCDIGRTEIITGVFAIIDGKPQLALKFSTATKDVTDFTAYVTPLIDAITKEHGITITTACFAAPGNTNAQKNFIRDAHLPFVIDGVAIQAGTTIKQVLVVNDFECTGFGIQAIDPAAIITLHPGKPREHGTRVIVGAGNGLGSGLMLWDAAHACYQPSPISYSFVEFCPQTELELAFTRYLQENTGSVSWGKVLGASGGIMRIYDFLNRRNVDESVPASYAHYLEIFANRFNDAHCMDAVKLYMHLYARLIRNVAYAQLPYNGIYITNTVAERNPELFTDPAFMQDVLDTNNQFLFDYLIDIPIYLATHPDMQMHGAALYALVYSK
jgi:glucokinase